MDVSKDMGVETVQQVAIKLFWLITSVSAVQSLVHRGIQSCAVTYNVPIGSKAEKGGLIPALPMMKSIVPPVILVTSSTDAYWGYVSR